MSRYVIDLAKLGENIEIIKQKAGVPIIGVVKGNGYGIGTNEFAKILKEHGIKTFAITETADITELKKVLDDEEILIMRSTCFEDEAIEIAKNGAIATIGSIKAAKVMDEVSKKLGVKTKCYLKIDTGMARYGFMPSQINDAIKCYHLENLDFVGAYTHFSSAFNNIELTKSQLEMFKDTMKQIQDAVGDVGILHCANSPALLNIDSVSLDTVRIGSAFTGRVVTNSTIKLNKIGSLEAEVIEIKNVPKGYAIGYNGMYKTKRDTTIAIVPIGHYDGFGLTKEHEVYNLLTLLKTVKKFLKKEQMYVKINGRSYHVIGNIGLSHTAIDVTGSDVKIGDVGTVEINPLMVNPKVERIYK